MALDIYALTTLAKVKTHLNVLDASQDAILERFINESSYIIEEYIDRKILTRSYTEYQDGRNNNRIILKQWPITAVAEVWSDPSSEFTDSANQIPSTDYRIVQEIEIALLTRSFGKGTHNVKVVYTAGFATTPYPLESACIWLVEYFYDIRSGHRVGTRSKSKNGETVSYMDAWPSWMVDQLDKWKRYEWSSANAPVLNG
jgi:Phage gp6-like head-tail connector protein